MLVACCLLQGAFFQPSDDTRHSMRMASHSILLEAYSDNMVSATAAL